MPKQPSMYISLGRSCLVSHVSPRAQTEKCVRVSSGAELLESQSQNSLASLGGTPSPFIQERSFGQQLCSTHGTTAQFSRARKE